MSDSKDELSSDMEAAIHCFKEWRQTRKKLCRIPDHLWKMAANLSNHYPVSTISRNLSLNWGTLRKKINQFSTDLPSNGGNPPSFIELKLNGQQPLSPLAHSSRCSVELVRPDGTVMRIFSSDDTALNLPELCKTFLKSEK